MPNQFSDLKEPTLLIKLLNLTRLRLLAI